MKIQIILLLLGVLAISFRTVEPDEKPIVLKAIKFDATTTKQMRGVSLPFLMVDKKGYCRVKKGHTILEYKTSGKIVFIRKGDEITKYDGTEKYGNVSVVCYGCTGGGCEPYETKSANGMTYGCSRCGDQSALSGCAGAVTIEKPKGIVDRETAEG